MLAFHNDPAIKHKFISRVRAHRLADTLVKGLTWENGKGCAVGCTLEKYDHSAYEGELGIPSQLAGLEDAIFEGLPNKLAMTWPERFLEAITPGADLSKVWHYFCVWLLMDEKDGVFRFNNHEAIRAVADLHAAAATGNMPNDAAWDAAWDAAREAWAEAADARDAADAWAAARVTRAAAAAADAADAAAMAAARVAWADARDAAAIAMEHTPADTAAAARAAAEAAACGDVCGTTWDAYVQQSEKLLGLLRAAQAS